jgi:hypothetical protein
MTISGEKPCLLLFPADVMRPVAGCILSDALYRELAARYGSIGNSGYSIEEILGTDLSLPLYVRVAPAADPGY